MARFGETFSLIRWGALAGWAFCCGAMAWYILQVAKEITYVTLADGRKQERKIPLLFRLLLPFVSNLDVFVMKPSFEKSRTLADRQLTAAGFEGLLSGREFLALKILSPVMGGIAWFLLLRGLVTVFPDSDLAENFPFAVFVGILLFYLYPVFWLRRELKTRHQSIQRALPFVLDLLTLSVEAGMDFMSALQRNCERRKLDPLNEELIRMLREIQVGTPRRTALRNLAERVGLADLRVVCNALIQADELGVSIGSILRIQSDQIRGKRFDRAEKLANEAPVKMLMPLLLFIFPSVIIILLGPILKETFVHLF